ncbi:MAG: hypothetical protein ABSB42_06200 [Tepidisphaeraceae bacterium]
MIDIKLLVLALGTCPAHRAMSAGPEGELDGFAGRFCQKLDGVLGGAEPRKTFLQTPNLGILRKIADHIRRQRSI